MKRRAKKTMSSTTRAIWIPSISISQVYHVGYQTQRFYKTRWSKLFTRLWWWWLSVVTSGYQRLPTLSRVFRKMFMTKDQLITFEFLGTNWTKIGQIGVLGCQKRSSNDFFFIQGLIMSSLMFLLSVVFVVLPIIINLGMSSWYGYNKLSLSIMLSLLSYLMLSSSPSSPSPIKPLE